MARSTFLRFAFIFSPQTLFFSLLATLTGEMKQKKVKMKVNREPRKEWKWRGKRGIRGSGPEEWEGQGDAWWFYLDINGSYNFL